MRKTRLRPDEVRAAVSGRLGALQRLEPLPEGEASQAFAGEIGGRPVVVRVGPTSAGYEKDRFVSAVLRPHVPVPEVLDSWRHDDRHVLCVSRRLAGRTADLCTPAEAAALGADVVRTHQALAATELSNTRGFGPFDGSGQAEFSSWSEYLTAGFEDFPELPATHRSAVERQRELLDAVARRLPQPRSLVHGDFGGNNLLTLGARVTGVLDWGQAMFGDPLYDVAWSLFWGRWVDPMRVHGAVLWSAWRDEPAAEDRLAGGLLHVGVTSCRYYLDTERVDTALSMVRRTDECLADADLSRPSP